MMNRIPAIGDAVELIADPFYSKNPFKKGMRGIVTGYKRPVREITDVVINGDETNSVDVSRVVGLGSRIYRLTNRRGPEQYEVAGCLLDDLAPGDLFVFYACDLSGRHAGQGYCLRYLNRKQTGLHYTDEQWVKDLLACGAIEDYLNPLAHEEPQRFNSVYDAPIGMVLKYMLDGHKAQGAVYPYVVRTWGGIWGWNKLRWVLIKPEHHGQWLRDIQAAWTAPAFFEEAFTYPIPCKAILYVQKLMGAANAK